MKTLEQLTQGEFRNKSNVKVIRKPFMLNQDLRKNKMQSKQLDFYMKQAYSSNF